MALGPLENPPALTQQQQNIFDAAESLIDAAVSDPAAYSDNFSSVFVTLPQAPPPRVALEIRIRYRRAGWSAVRVNDTQVDLRR